MDYGTKALKELIKKIENMPINELKKIINEADLKFKKIQTKRGVYIKIPAIQRDNYKETVLDNNIASDYSFRMAA